LRSSGEWSRVPRQPDESRLNGWTDRPRSPEYRTLLQIVNLPDGETYFTTRSCALDVDGCSRPIDPQRLFVAFALSGLVAQLGCDEQALELRRRQAPGALALSTNSKLILR
jgi:hypothetical protein